MKCVQTGLDGLLIIEPQIFADERGWFQESFNERRFRDALAELNLDDPPAFVQDNHSCSKAGVLRGLHYQVAPHEQAKLVRVVRGSIFDVSVDLREGSAMRGRWFGVELSERNHRQIWIPAGFAHGFVALEDDTHVLYKATAHHAPAYERTIHWRDPTLDIAWPKPPGGAFVVSDKDDAARFLGER